MHRPVEYGTRAGLSQRELAKRAGTTASVICRLEDADYEGHSLAMLRRIAAALDRRLEIRSLHGSGGFNPLGTRRILSAALSAQFANADIEPSGCLLRREKFMSISAFSVDD